MKKRKDIKVINEREANYTFVDAGFIDIKKSQMVTILIRDTRIQKRI